MEFDWYFSAVIHSSRRLLALSVNSALLQNGKEGNSHSCRNGSACIRHCPVLHVNLLNFTLTKGMWHLLFFSLNMWNTRVQSTSYVIYLFDLCVCVLVVLGIWHKALCMAACTLPLIYIPSPQFSSLRCVTSSSTDVKLSLACVGVVKQCLWWILMLPVLVLAELCFSNHQIDFIPKSFTVLAALMLCLGQKEFLKLAWSINSYEKQLFLSYWLIESQINWGSLMPAMCRKHYWRMLGPAVRAQTLRAD